MTQIFSFDIVLNEMSFNDPLPENIYQTREKMELFINTLHQYKSVDQEEIKSLLVETNVMQIHLSHTYTIQSWCYDREVNEDQRNFFLGLSTTRPFMNIYETEGRYNNRPVRGLAIAAFCELPGISIAFHEDWNVNVLSIEMLFPNEAIQDYETRHINVYHACCTEHVNQNIGWIRSRIETIRRERKKVVKSGSELWNRREELFPHLMFSSDLYRDLRKIRQGDANLSHIVGMLFSLERYCIGWESGAFDIHSLPGRPRQETNITLQQFGHLRMFSYPDGQRRMFSWHVSIGTHYWRLYFEPFYPEQRASYQNKRMIIGYIGDHLPTATEG